jgi:hypothetical protein
MKTNHREKSKKSITKVTHNFSPEVHMLAVTLRPHCVDHHFVVRWLIGNPKPSSPRAPQEPTASEVTQWHEQFTRVAFGVPPRKAQHPLTNHWEVAKNKHHSCHNSSAASKPSRWRQPLRVTRIPQPMLTQVPTRCKLTSKCTRDHSNSLWFVNQAREMSGRGCAQLKRMLESQIIQERSPKASQQVFISVPTQNSRYTQVVATVALTGRAGRTDRTLCPRSVMPRCSIGSLPHVHI